MIESIAIADVATFASSPETLIRLSQFNFVFGSNGSGKTTISRIIADEESHLTCKVTWKGGTKLQAMVYNRDFVERNFSPSTELEGVFTLGEKHAETLAQIAASKVDLDLITKKIENLNGNLQGNDGTGGKKGELTTVEADLKNKCWVQKQKYDAMLYGAFEGVRNNAERFKGKILQELATNTAAILPLADLKNKAGAIFGQTPTTEATVIQVNAAKLIEHEGKAILKKRVIGKEDVDIAAMIKRLGNSDWVREGRTFLDVNDRVCPFCQQTTEAEFARSLDEYFDETFLTDSKTIEDLATDYSADAGRLQQQIEGIIASPSRFLDVEKLKMEKQLLDSKVTINLQRLAEKKKEASRVVELDSLSNIVTAIQRLVDGANQKVREHNAMVANLAEERRTLTAQVWKFVLEELKSDLASYRTAREGLDKAITSLTLQIQTATEEKAEKATEISGLERQTTSVQPTIDAINRLLSSFGFQSFSIAKAASGTSYKLVRANGSDAQTTLSEGEKTFVTFLYFYHLLKGSNSESGMTNDRVVVIDDPVSSLDSDILFIVGSLIKGLFEEVRAGTGHIKQVFILTHNVYFHKEVTFNSKRPKDVSMNEETFWVVRKPELVSKVEAHTSNPIKTSYELLWSEVRRIDRSNLTIQNTLRRILENYFKILGDIDPDRICAMFDGREKLICKSLFSWVNDGSHFAHDDLYMSMDGSAVETYLRVFRAIFEKSSHSAHYEMMMGDAFVREPSAVIPEISPLIQGAN